MIDLKSPLELDAMRAAGRLVAQCFAHVGTLIRPGVSTEELDAAIRQFVVGRGGEPLFFRYKGFPANSCISINEEVVHGIPSLKRKLREGDIVSIDVGVRYRGFCGDSAYTFPVGKVGPEAERLLAACQGALDEGIAAARVGLRVSDISRAIQNYAESRGYSVVRQFVGHGIGRKMHEKPQVPNYVDAGFRKEDIVLQPGVVLAIEPMLNVGTAEVETLKDRWTVVTQDRRLSAHFEHTVAVTEEGPQVLTLP